MIFFFKDASPRVTRIFQKTLLLGAVHIKNSPPCVIVKKYLFQGYGSLFKTLLPGLLFQEGGVGGGSREVDRGVGWGEINDTFCSGGALAPLVFRVDAPF